MIKIELTPEEVKILIFACDTTIADRCVGKDEEEPYELLIHKLKKAGEK